MPAEWVCHNPMHITHSEKGAFGCARGDAPGVGVLADELGQGREGGLLALHGECGRQFAAVEGGQHDVEK